MTDHLAPYKGHEAPAEQRDSAGLCPDDIPTSRAGEPSPGALDLERGDPPPLGLVQGSQVGRYSILSRLGQGGMGVVYKAWDPQLDRPVALKVLREDRLTVGRDADMRGDLLREAQTLAKLSHPNIVTVYDAGLTQQGVFIAMELCTGVTLYRWIRAQQPDVAEILRVFTAAGRGLAAAHAAKIVHRDFKPGNVLINDDGTVRVADFGLAHLVDRAAGELAPTDTAKPVPEDMSDSDVHPDGDWSATSIVGTPIYMAPEQLLGRQGDHRLDQFAFCLALYEALLDVPAFPGRTFEDRRDVVPQGLGAAARDRLMRARQIPAPVRRALLRGLSTDPQARFASMNALLDSLAERRRWPWMVASAALVLGFGGGALLGLRSGPEQEAPCANPQAALKGVWGPGDKRRVERAFVVTGHPRAASMFDRIERRLDDYSVSWVEGYAQACHDTYVTRQQSEAAFDARMRCLQGHRNQFRATIDTLTEAPDARRLQERMVAPFRLPLVDECADARPETGEHALPEDPELRAEVDRIAEELDVVDTLRAAGDFSTGIERAVTAVEDARRAGYIPLLARSLGSLGHLQLDGSSAKQAEQTLRETIEVASRAAAHSVEARAWALLLFAMVEQHRADEGLALGFAADVTVQLSQDATAQSWLLNSLGALHAERGDFEDAQASLNAALELKTRQLGPTHVEVGIAWFNLANLLTNRGDAGAREALDNAEAIFAATVGPEHPYSQYTVGALCRLDLQAGEFERANERCAAVLADLERSSAAPRWRSRVHFRRARALAGLGQLASAREHAAIARDLIAADDPTRAGEIEEWLVAHRLEPAP